MVSLCRDISVTVFVGHAVNEIDEIRQVVEGPLLYIRTKIGEIWTRRFPWGTKMLKDTKNCNVFLDYTERDEVWQGEGHLCVAGHYSSPILSRVPRAAIPCGDMHQSFTDVLFCRSHFQRNQRSSAADIS